MPNLMKRRTAGLDQLESLANTLFSDESVNFPLAKFDKGFYPSLDLSETEDNYVIELEAPGLEKDRIDISVSNNVLTIKKIERSFGSFSRQVTLPEIDRDREIDAVYKQGLLRVVVPKAEKERVKKIDVTVE